MNKSRRLKGLNWRSIAHVALSLGTTVRELEGILARKQRLYRSRSEIKPNGKIRQIDAPQGRLKEILRRLNGCLQRVELHEGLHGGVRGHSNITNADCHLQRPGMVSADVQDFFPSVRRARVHKIFAIRLRCSPPVANLLTDLACFRGTLPQGSPASQILAAFAAEGMSRRLAGLADSVGGTATVYVDDTTLSGPVHVTRRARLVGKIVEQEGFTPHPKKSKVLGLRDTKVVTGVKVSGRRDAPPDMLQEIETILAEFERGERLISKGDLDSLRGRINYVRQLNEPRAANFSRRLARLPDFS